MVMFIHFQQIKINVMFFVLKKNSTRDITKGLFNVLFEKSKKPTTMDGAMIGLGWGAVGPKFFKNKYYYIYGY